MIVKRIHVRLAAAAILLILIFLRTPAQQQSTSIVKTETPTIGTISGRVVSESGQPLLGASVFVRAIGSLNSGRITSTDTEGNFQVGNLDPAAYSIAASLPAYAMIPNDPDAPASYYRAGDSVRLELVKGGIITGTVTNATGDPVVAVRVRAYLIRDAKGRSPKAALTSFSERTTDDRGVYRIYGLAPGTYVAYAGGPGASQGFGINAYDSDVPTYAPSSTRDMAAEITVRAGEESGGDIRYKGEPGHIVSGIVKFQGTIGGTIALVQVGNGFMPAGNSYQPPGGRGFAFSGIGDGDYDLVAQEVVSPQGLSFPEMASSEPRRITVKGADVTGLELTTKALSTISGRLALEPSKDPACTGKRSPLLAETLINLQPNEKVSDKEPPQYLRTYTVPGVPDKEGAFVLRNVLAGQYVFNPSFFAKYWYLRSITLVTPPTGAVVKPAQTNLSSDAARNWTAVRFGDRITGLTITLAEGAASLRGRVDAGEGSKLPANLFVYLIPTEREKAEDVLRFSIAAVAADGSFALNNIPPGHYWPIAHTLVGNASTNTAKLRLPGAANVRTQLRREGEKLNLETEMKPCQNVTDYKLPLKPH